MVFRGLGHAEERDDGLIAGIDERGLEGVPVEGDALQSGDGVYGGATSD